MNHQVRVLKNGLKVIVIKTDGPKVMSAQLWAGAGSADETVSNGGIAHVIEHMIFKGTPSRRVGEISSEIDTMGGAINAWTSFDETVFHLTVQTKFAKQSLQLLSDAIFNPLFDEHEFAKEKSVILEEIYMDYDDPETVASLLMFKNLFKDNSYGAPITGFPGVVSKFTRNDLLDFYKRFYRPNNLTLVIAGNFSIEKIFLYAEEFFTKSPLNKLTKKIKRYSPLKINTDRKCSISVKKMPHSLCSVAIGLQVPQYTHDDVPALDVLGAILGQGQSSRLERILVRNSMLAEDIDAMAYTPWRTGLLNIFAKVKSQNLAPFFKELCLQLNFLTQNILSSEEVNKAVRLLKGDDAFSYESVEAVARKAGYSSLYTGNPDYDASVYYEKISRVTPGDIKRVAEKYITKDSITAGIIIPDSQKEDNRQIKKIITDSITEAFKKSSSKNIKMEKKGSRYIYETDDGDTIIIEPVKGAKTVSARAAFLFGQSSEPSGSKGILHIMSSLLTRGSSLKSPDEFAKIMDLIPSSIQGFSGKHTFGISGEFLAQSFNEGFELMSEALLHPLFSQKEIDREIEITKSMIEESSTKGKSIAFRNFKKTLFKDHIYGCSIYGTMDSLNTINSKNLSSFYNRAIQNKMVLSICGAVNVNEAVNLAGTLFKREYTAPPSKEVKPWSHLKKSAQIVKKIDSEQSHVVIGFKGTTLHDEQKYPLDILMEIIGGSSGRLFNIIREKLSLAYEVSSFSFEGLVPGFAAFYAAITPGNEVKVVEIIKKELLDIILNGPSKEEFKRVKSSITGLKKIASQNYATRSADMSLGYIYGLGEDSEKKYIDSIEKVTLNQVRAAAELFFKDSKMIISLAGPVDENINLIG
ncbi:MAG: insulinase family protein [Deltaproteobacteria bacterium]|nr:insulinase family protein [Deltaproteobacteria bacterium]